MNAYAQTTDLATWLGTAAPADAARLLLRASELIDSYVMAGYDVDTNGLPTDTDVASTLKDAVCSQVEFWLEVGEENSIDGLAGTKVSVGGYSGDRAPDIAPRALDLLGGSEYEVNLMQVHAL